MTGTTELRSEHRHILAVIACLRAACGAARGGAGFDADTFRQGVDFIRNYADTGAHYERLARTLCERWKIDPDEDRSRPVEGGCHSI